MSCTCLLRQSARASSSRLSAARAFSSSRSTFSAAPAKPALATPSICPPGTSFAWTQLAKTAQPAAAKEDSEYPAWLWALAPQAAPGGAKKGAAAAAAAAAGGDKGVSLKEQVRQLRRDGKKAIKASNTLKGK